MTAERWEGATVVVARADAAADEAEARVRAEIMADVPHRYECQGPSCPGCMDCSTHDPDSELAPIVRGDDQPTEADWAEFGRWVDGEDLEDVRSPWTS